MDIMDKNMEGRNKIPLVLTPKKKPVDEATVIGYGAGLVACVVSLAVGFSIGYGTLVKP